MNTCLFRIWRSKARRLGLSLYLLALAALACSPGQGELFRQGKDVYESYCAACHGSNGAGVLYRLSALDRSPLVLGNANQVIGVILKGREGQGWMPGWHDKLSDREVAAVATYIRQAWSNRAGPVTPEIVAALRNK